MIMTKKIINAHSLGPEGCKEKNTVHLHKGEISLSKKKKKNSKPNICTVLRDLTDNFCTETFPGGWTHTHTHIYIILIRLLYYLPLTSRIEKKFKKKNTTKNLQNTEENMQNTL